MNNLAKTCPSTKVWVMGYSQGAMVAQVVLEYAGSGNGKSGETLSTKAIANFGAAILLGDPTYYQGETVDWSGNTGTSNGAFYWTRTKGSDDDWPRTPYRIISYCCKGDYWCQADFTPYGSTVHGSYKSAATVKREVAFLKEFE